MKALGVPVHNTYGLRPALVKGTDEIAPLTPFHDLDSLGLLRNVPTLNFHPHLPHYEVTGAQPPSRCWRGRRSTSNVRTLSRRPGRGSSTACCGRRRTNRGPEISFWSIPPISPHSLAAPRVRDLLEKSRGDEVSGARADRALEALARFVRARQTVAAPLAHWALIAGVLSVASPVLADWIAPTSSMGPATIQLSRWARSSFLTVILKPPVQASRMERPKQSKRIRLSPGSRRRSGSRRNGN